MIDEDLFYNKKKKKLWKINLIDRCTLSYHSFCFSGFISSSAEINDSIDMQFPGSSDIWYIAN